MASKKLCLFIDKVSNVLTKFDTNTIKTTIGDSTNNNRTCTVSQICRFLKMKRKTAMANQLASIAVCLKTEMQTARTFRFTNRKDSFDINELMTCCRTSKGSMIRNAAKLVA